MSIATNCRACRNNTENIFCVIIGIGKSYKFACFHNKSTAPIFIIRVAVLPFFILGVICALISIDRTVHIKVTCRSEFHTVVIQNRTTHTKRNSCCHTIKRRICAKRTRSICSKSPTTRRASTKYRYIRGFGIPYSTYTIIKTNNITVVNFRYSIILSKYKRM